MKHTKEQETATPEQYRAELIEEKQRLQAELVGIKSSMANAFIIKDQQRMAELSNERAEIVKEIAEIDSDLRQLKQEIHQPSNSMSDLNIIVQLVAAEIAYSGRCDAQIALSRLNAIKTILSSKQSN